MSSPDADRSREQLAKDKGQDSAVAVVIDLDRRVDAQAQRDGGSLAVGVRDAHEHLLAGLEVFVDTDKIECFRAIEFERLGVGAFGELQWKHTHTDEVRAMN